MSPDFSILITGVDSLSLYIGYILLFEINPLMNETLFIFVYNFIENLCSKLVLSFCFVMFFSVF